jgi:hypothetical protein
MPLPRRSFLGWLGAGLIVPSASRGTWARESLPDHPPPVSPDWDMSWVERITGDYRAAFDAPAVDEGSGLWRACMWRDQYQEVYGVDKSNLSAVLVIRHKGIPLIMDDWYWDYFKVGKDQKLKDPATSKWSTVNPIRTTPSDMPPQYADYNLERFMATGGIVLACHMAFQLVTARFRKEYKLETDEAEARAKEHVIPGIILQPSGIFAVLRAQQAGCSYVLAT